MSSGDCEDGLGEGLLCGEGAGGGGEVAGEAPHHLGCQSHHGGEEEGESRGGNVGS